MNLENIPDLSAEESTTMMKDIIKVLTVIAVVHLLLYTIDEKVEILDDNTIKLSLYITLGLVAYHMGTKKLIKS